MAASAAGPPIRFLVLVVGVWTVGRAVALWPGGDARPVFARSDAAAARPAPARERIEPLVEPTGKAVASANIAQRAIGPSRLGLVGASPPTPVPFPRPAATDVFQATAVLRQDEEVLALANPSAAAVGRKPFATPDATPVLAAPFALPRQRRFTLDAALALRGGGVARPVEPSLGGSQAYLIARRPLGDRMTLTGRLTTALSDGRARQAEAAVGVGLRPARSIPFEFVAERRVALSTGGRNAWQLRAIGGGQLERDGWRLESYGQAGVAGARSRDLFADGEARVSRPLLGPLRAGALVAGAAQPGAARIDVGPQLRVDLPGRTALLTSYRLRVAGNAAPSSGPAVTLAASF